MAPLCFFYFRVQQQGAHFSRDALTENTFMQIVSCAAK